MSGEARLFHPAQRADGLGQRNTRVRPVNEQQIDLGQPQPDEAFLGGTLELGRRKMILPYLRGDEDIVAPDAGRAQPFADFALVAVHFRGVDMAITELQRLLDHPGADAATQIPRAEADRRNARSVRLYIWYRHRRLAPKPHDTEKSRPVRTRSRATRSTAAFLLSDSRSTLIPGLVARVHASPRSGEVFWTASRSDRPHCCRHESR